MRAARLGLIVLGFLAGPVAQAQTTPTPTPTPTTPTFTKEDFLIRLQRKEGNDWVFIPAIEAKYYFNRARCECATPIRVTVDLTMAGFQKRTLIQQGTVQMRIGPTQCVDTAPQTVAAANCKNPLGGDTGTLFSSLPLNAPPAWKVDLTVKDLFASTGSKVVAEKDICNGRFTQKIWLWLPNPANSTPLLAGDQAPQLDIDIDGEPPPAPVNIEVTPGNEALAVKWARVTGIPDINGYVVFCSRAEKPVFAESFFNGRDFYSPKNVCMSTAPPSMPMPPAVPPNNDAARGQPIMAPDQLRGLDPAYACSPLLTSATSARVSVLQNGIPYVVGVASVDRLGNASPIEVAYIQRPILTRDFYRGYRESGGEAEGGFCAYGQRPSGAGWVLGLLGAPLALALARRTRGRRR